MSLTEELQTIDGVGEKTAEKILEIVESADCAECPNPGNGDFDVEAFEEGMEYYRVDDYTYAKKFFEQVLE